MGAVQQCTPSDVECAQRAVCLPAGDQWDGVQAICEGLQEVIVVSQ